MTGDYLWDRSGPLDPEVLRLERVLGTLRQAMDETAVLHFPARVPARRPAPAFMAVVLTLAASVVALIAVSWRSGAPQPGFEVTRLAGTPTIGAPADGRERSVARGELARNRRGQARASIDIASDRPDSRSSRVHALGLVSTRPGEHRLQLVRGTMHAIIWAPPGQFVVDTPSSTAVDLGMRVHDDGRR